jgi:hypothetical protein
LSNPLENAAAEVSTDAEGAADADADPDGAADALAEGPASGASLTSGALCEQARARAPTAVATAERESLIGEFTSKLRT